jgi:hypothetical protein
VPICATSARPAADRKGSQRYSLGMPRQVVVPMPESLRTCPGKEVWDRYRDEEWLVFIDESFCMFFELTARSGYFCYSAVGVPAREYPQLCADVKALLPECSAATGQTETELKYGHFKRLPYRTRRRFALRIRDIVTRSGAFIAGFYTPSRAFVLERVRTNLLDDEAVELPEDDETLCADAIAQLIKEHGNRGQAGVIGKLLWLPTASVANLLSSLNARFTIICDPRDQRREDPAVRAKIEDVMEMSRNLKNIPDTDLRSDLADHFLGIRGDRTSTDEPGLQLADMMVGEIKEFFQAFPGLMSWRATRRLVTQLSKEPLVTAIPMRGLLWKTGVLYPMPPGLVAHFMKPDPQERTVLPMFRNMFAAGMLTCYSVTGQPRNVLPFERMIWDQTDS